MHDDLAPPGVITPARSSAARNRLALSREEPASCAMSACVAAPARRGLGPLRLSCLTCAEEALATRPARSGTTAARSARWRLVRGGPATASILTAMSGWSSRSRRMSLGEERHRAGGLERLHVAERVSPPNIASSPNMSPRPQLGERDRAPVAVRLRGLERPGADHVAGVARVTLPEHHLAGVVAPRHRDGRQLVQLRVGQPGEHLQAREQRPVPSPSGTAEYHTPSRFRPGARADATRIELCLSTRQRRPAGD